MVRTQRHPVNYYDIYPYAQNYEDYYYPQESYPMYYPARTSKYEVYQAVLPYYYGERPVSGPGYGYYGHGDNDPVGDLQEEMLQEAEREEREESQPIGQEMLYENEGSNSDDSLDDANAAFLQNLIMSQMYKDAIDNQKDYYDPNPYSEYYSEDSKWEDSAIEPKQNYRQEDEDVRELKQLTKLKNNKQETDDIHWFQNGKYKNQNKWDGKRAIINPIAFKKEEFDESQKDSVAFTSRKPSVKSTSSTSSTTSAPTTSEPSKNNVSGQKEEVLARPATPVRHPFSAPVLDMLTKNEEDHKRTPSVYDTIKHMLDMEKDLENVSNLIFSFRNFQSGACHSRD